MESRLVLEEKYSTWWVQITAGLALAAALLFILFSNMDDVLWKGIVRLASFGFLAAAVFSGLKVMEGKHSIILEIKDGYLIVSCQKRDRQVGEDVFELKKITSLYVDHLPSYLFSTDVIFNDLQVVIKQTDSDRPLSLIEVDGRALALSKETAEETVKFISGHAGDIEIPEQYREYLQMDG